MRATPRTRARRWGALALWAVRTAVLLQKAAGPAITHEPRASLTRLQPHSDLGSRSAVSGRGDDHSPGGPVCPIVLHSSFVHECMDRAQRQAASASTHTHTSDNDVCRGMSTKKGAHIGSPKSGLFRISQSANRRLWFGSRVSGSGDGGATSEDLGPDLPALHQRCIHPRPADEASEGQRLRTPPATTALENTSNKTPQGRTQRASFAHVASDDIQRRAIAARSHRARALPEEACVSGRMAPTLRGGGGATGGKRHGHHAPRRRAPSPRWPRPDPAEPRPPACRSASQVGACGPPVPSCFLKLTNSRTPEGQPRPASFTMGRGVPTEAHVSPGVAERHSRLHDDRSLRKKPTPLAAPTTQNSGRLCRGVAGGKAGGGRGP